MLLLMMVLCVLDEYDMLEDATDIYIQQASSVGSYPARIIRSNCGIASCLIPLNSCSREIVVGQSSVLTISGVQRCRSEYDLTFEAFEAFSYFSGGQPRVYLNDAAAGL